jgi:hypothetical protein
VLNNTYWLKDKILTEIETEAWVAPLLVFSNAFVERGAPIKGIRIINKKYLPNELERSNPRAQNDMIWQSRDKLEASLSN